MTFTLDTSGVVYVLVPGCVTERPRVWSDLSPFAQGYVEAALTEFVELSRLAPGKHTFWVGFRHLAPETLAVILRDCEAFNTRIGDASHNRGIGAKFWESRRAGFTSFWSLHQAEFRAAFPPLQPYLSDEGRVCLRPSAQGEL